MQHIFFTTEIEIIKQVINDRKMEGMVEKHLHYTDSIFYELEQTARLMRILTLQLFEQLGIKNTLDEYAMLDMISMNAGICQRDLAKLILKDRANTGRLLNSLEEKGFITRFIDTKNNRLVKKMGITEKGLQELDTINKKIKSYMDGTTKKIPPEEVERVQETLKKFRIDLEKVVNMNV